MQHVGMTWTKGVYMYENIKQTIIRTVTIRRVVYGCIGLLLIIFVGSLIRGYYTTRADYQRTIERLESTQKQLDASRRINEQLKSVIERGQKLNRQAGQRIDRIEEYQRQTGERIDTSLAANQRAKELVRDSLDIIKRVDERNQAR